MKQDWTDEDLIERWTLEQSDYALLANKSGATRLGFAVLLKYFQLEARFPATAAEVPASAIVFLARQLKIPTRLFAEYDWQGRLITYHRKVIREKFNFREITVLDEEAAVNWLVREILPIEANEERFIGELYRYFRNWKIEPPTDEQMMRLVRSAQSRFESVFVNQIFERLSDNSVAKLSALLDRIEEIKTVERDGEKPESTVSEAEANRTSLTTLAWLRSEPGKLKLETVQDELKKLDVLRELELPANLFDGYSAKIVAAYRRRLLAESLQHTRRHELSLQMTLLSAFCFLRQSEVIDNLIEFRSYAIG